VVKTGERQNHQDDLCVVFNRLRNHQLKMNPLKCAFGVKSGVFLGFIVHHRGIEIEPKKIKAIFKMPPQIVSELKSMQGHLSYIRRFISNPSGHTQSFMELMRKGVSFHWDEQCQNALDSLKRYLLNPLVLAAPVKCCPLIVYIATQPTSIGALLALHNGEGKEVACYYLSRALVGAKNNYSPIEKLCLALVFSLKKLRHYIMAHVIQLIARADPVRYVLNQPTLMGRLGKWAVIMIEFDITYVPQEAIKGQAFAEFLAAHPVPNNSPLVVDLPDEDVFTVGVESPWDLYFDGASRIEINPDGAQRRRTKAGLVFKTP
jgi:hypothetical protein